MSKLTRRQALVTSGVVGANLGLWGMRPRDRSGDRATYFVELQQALRKVGVATPTLVIDRERLSKNIRLMKAYLPEAMQYRVVAKSLPAVELIKHVCEVSASSRLMTFNLPMLLGLSRQMPEADQLIGKPMPIEAAKSYFARVSDRLVTQKIQWLIDTPNRLAQYEQLAQSLNLSLRVNIELDVGLRRGGFSADRHLESTLRKISQSQYLSFAGFMGYEAHIGALPEVLGIRRRACERSWSAYSEAIAMARRVVGSEAVDGSVRNAGGSPTYRLYRSTEVANEVAVGSALVKPTHFDTDLLYDHQPASYIATPVIKRIDRTKMPSVLSWFDGIRHAWDPNYRRTLFIYGGNWLADPVDPPGLAYNSAFGRSSNQEMLNVGPKSTIDVDDFVFFRPHQSEAVFQQFGDIAVYDRGEIREWWQPFSSTESMSG